MSFFTSLLKQSASLVVTAGLLGLASGAFNAQLIALVNQHINGAAGTSWFTSGGFFAVLIVVALLTGVLTQIAITYLAERLSLVLREQLCRRVLAMPLAQMETVGRQRLTASLAQDIPAITTALMGIPVLVINTAITLGCLVYLGFLSWPTMLYLLGFIVFAVITYQIPERFALIHLARNREQWNQFYNAFDGLIEGAKELELNHQRRTAYFRGHILEGLHALRGSALVFQLLYAVLNHWSKLLYFVFIAGLLFVLGPQQGLDARTLSGFVIIVLYLIAPIDSIIDIVPKFRAATIAYRNMNALSVRFEPGDAEEHALIDPFDPEPTTIRLDGLSYSFFRDTDSRPFTLGPLDLTLETGQIYFIVGGNGSGKTTLAKLLTGLYSPEDGVVRYGGAIVDDQNRAAYRQRFSAIFSDFHLFEDLHGVIDETRAKSVQTYLEILQLSHKVTIENGRLSTTKLSTGQRKRLALLSAYLEDRPFYLFDEWAADQDPEFKKVFYETLLPELKARGKTLLVISHDDRFFHLADHILMMRDGQLEITDGSRSLEISSQ